MELGKPAPPNHPVRRSVAIGVQIANSSELGMVKIGAALPEGLKPYRDVFL